MLSSSCSVIILRFSASCSDLLFSLQPLYRYLQGNNAAGLKLDMAKPVITRITPTDSSFTSTGTDYTMLFYLPDLSKVRARFCYCMHAVLERCRVMQRLHLTLCRKAMS